jgi:hypothetical protein
MAGGKHSIIFNGEIFDQKDEFKMLKSYFLGLFSLLNFTCALAPH